MKNHKKKLSRKSSVIILEHLELGAFPLDEGGGAKHSPLTGVHENHKNHQKTTFPKIIMDHPRALRNTPGHL